MCVCVCVFVCVCVCVPVCVCLCVEARGHPEAIFHPPASIYLVFCDRVSH